MQNKYDQNHVVIDIINLELVDEIWVILLSFAMLDYCKFYNYPVKVRRTTKCKS